MNRLIRILHLEDDPIDAELVQAKIEAAGLICQITCVKARDEFEATLRQGGYDIILADFQLPRYDGMSALRLAQELCPDIPFIFVSGAMGEEAVIEGLTEGATDYVLKQRLSRLASAIPRALHEVENRRERRRAEEELRKLSQAVEQNASIIIITDIQGYIEYANPRFTEITGYTLAEAKGQHTRILKSGHTPPEEYQQLWETITSGKEWRGEFLNKKKNGELYWESALISPIKAADGTITHFLATKEDITERKRAEETQANLEKQLRKAQRMESIGRLAGGIAHDFNNLLVPIIGYVDLHLADLSPKSRLYADLTQVRKAADRAADLTRQILAFSRQQVLELSMLDLNTIIDEFKKMLQRLIGENIELRTVLSPHLYPVRADRGQVEQVLMNLTINSRDAMPEGGKLTIETANVFLDETYLEKYASELAPGHYVMLAISDTGQGMDAETQKRIFDPFFTTKESGKGTGLGLATVFGIIKQHQGHIWVYSEPGQGTTFKIYLPQTEDTIQTIITTPKEPLSIHGTETVLVVEDDQMVRKLVSETLEAHGYDVIEAQSPTNCLELAYGKDIIHLLLTDVIMPEMNGKELYQKLITIHPNSRVLYMSGYTNDVIVHHGILDEGINFLQKPFTVQNLTRKVREILN